MSLKADVNCNFQFPNFFTPFESQNLQLLPLLQSCKHLNHLKQIHTQILKGLSAQQNLLPRLVESLVDSDQIDYAAKVFDEIPNPSTSVFNLLIRGYKACGLPNEGFKLFVEMQYRGVPLNKHTYVHLVKACDALDQGKGAHCFIIKTLGCNPHIYLQNTLIGFYSNPDYGDLKYARLVFDRMSERDVASFTAMISGYLMQGMDKEAIALSLRMQNEGITMGENIAINVIKACCAQKMYAEALSLYRGVQIQGLTTHDIVYTFVLTACAQVRGFKLGASVHGVIIRNEILLTPTLATVLMEMYAKCGYIQKACKVFESLTDCQRDVCTWTSLIGKLANNGYGEEAIRRFEQMKMSGIEPDGMTFTGVLSACANSTMVEKGREYFYSMQNEYKIVPSINHYGCMVNMLAKAGHLEEAYEVIQNMPFKPDAGCWGALLSSCSTHSNSKLGEIAVQHLRELEPVNDERNYVELLHIYASNNQWDDFTRIKKILTERKF